MIGESELRNRFSDHEPRDTQPERYRNIRAQALTLALHIDAHAPDSREKSLAITHLEDAVFWANAAIARNEYRS
jgi:hypothetical protein